MRALLSRPRAGLTLVELLVVLVILAITTTIVPLAWRTTPATEGRAVDGLTRTARREAIRRSEELRLRLDADGAWVLAAHAGTDILETGRLAAPAAPLSLRIDALGTCRPGGGAGDSGAPFDMLSCRYLGRQIASEGVAP